MKRWRYVLIFLVLLLSITGFPLAKQVNSYMQPKTEGNYVLLRLEDVGPGGFYDSLEGLGKLRAVLEYLHQQKVPYHITIVSRWKQYVEGKGWYEASIDTPTPLTESFVKVLRQAQDRGAILGMHGYSHQYGDAIRADGQHNSGYGNEFKVKGEPDSEREDYAAERIEKSLRAFEQNGLFPAFWESPHYNSTRDQQRVFRSYMGIIYEPNWYQLRSLKDIVYEEEENHWKEKSLGSVYIPAPLRYIFNRERVQEVLSRLDHYDGLASMYFHPYLEFEYLEPVMVDGTPLVHDGIPIYQYKKESKSPLHELVEGIQKTSYTFGTIHDVVPWSPAHRIPLQKGIKPDQLLTGDVNGDGKDDWIIRDTREGKVWVTLSNIQWPRNRKPPASEVFPIDSLPPQVAKLLSQQSPPIQQRDLQSGDYVLSGDTNGDGYTDMVFYNEKDGIWKQARSNGKETHKMPVSFGPWGRIPNGIPILGDWDGNGKADLGIYNPQTGSLDLALSYQK